MDKKQLGLLAGTLTAVVLMGAGCNSSVPNDLDNQGQDKQNNTAASQTPNNTNYQTDDNKDKEENEVEKNDDVKTITPTDNKQSVETKETVKEFVITGKNWDWSPSTITVKKGDKVRLKITSTDIEHGFAIKDFNINVKLAPGQTQVVEFVADKVGTFGFRCNVPCGEGHREMTGTLIVQ